jgi:hypothetical protein
MLDLLLFEELGYCVGGDEMNKIYFLGLRNSYSCLLQFVLTWFLSLLKAVLTPEFYRPKLSVQLNHVNYRCIQISVTQEQKSTQRRLRASNFKNDYILSAHISQGSLYTRKDSYDGA